MIMLFSIPLNQISWSFFFTLKIYFCLYFTSPRGSCEWVRVLLKYLMKYSPQKTMHSQVTRWRYSGLNLQSVLDREYQTPSQLFAYSDLLRNVNTFLTERNPALALFSKSVLLLMVIKKPELCPLLVLSCSMMEMF